MTNIILNTDSYKLSHYLQYPKGTKHINSYIEARKSAISNEVVHFGLQAYLAEYLTEPFYKEDIETAEEISNLHGLPFNKEGWMHIKNKHGGLLPLRIQGLPEGMVVPIGTPQVQVINTDPEVPWLTSYMETAILRAIWYPSTVATISRLAKKVIYKYLEETADRPDLGIDFKLHDFGARGCTSEQQAELGGMAHLVNFKGTDTLSSIIAVHRYYPTFGLSMPGFSIPAAEHSTIMAWPNEESAFANMIDKFSGENKLYAVVSDTYNIFDAVDNLWGKTLKNLVTVRGGTLVVRPDSGDPVTVTEYVIKSLANSFGSHTNSKGYMVLNPSVRVIQGDGVNLQSIEAILKNLKEKKISADNIAFGMGAGLLQKVNRDTFSYAMKASCINIDGVWRDISKTPLTDPSKASKSGILAVYKDNEGNIRTCKRQHLVSPAVNLLTTVFENGNFVQEYDFNEVRANAAI